MVKKLFLILINVIIMSLFVVLPVSAVGNSNDFSNANFTGVNFNWHSGPALSPSAPSGFSHYLIIYSAPGTWYTGDRDYAYYYLVNDYITSINLRIDNGGCTLVTTSPTSATPYSAYLRSCVYKFSSSSGYELDSDAETSVGTINRSFSTAQSKRVCIITDLPCYDQNGDLVGNVDTLPHFYFRYFMDGAGVYHHCLDTTATSVPPNTSVTWYVVNGAVNTPVGAVYDTIKS